MWQIFWFNRTHRFWDENAREKWESLLVNQAKEYRRRALELGGLLIKFGQFLSTRADLLPPVFLNELEGLVDRVESVPPSISKRIIQQEWDGDIEDYVQEIEDQPVASASIGEVYKAYLLDGTPIAIKVQRHRVEEIFRTDFKALRIVFWILARVTSFGKKSDLGALYRELVEVISKELDFEKELKHSIYFKERYKDWEGVYVPEYYEHLSTRRVMVMEWIEGAKVTDSSFIRENNLNREQIAKRVFDIFTDQLISAGMFHADPHSGNLMIRADGTIVMIDFGMVGEIKQGDANNIRMLIQGFILNDYDQVINALEKMDFLLPHANYQKLKRLLNETADMYLSGNFEKLDHDLINQILKDVQELVQDQPIQLPADYAFLGRSSSIVIGVLTSVYPEIDLMKWGKPVIQKWVSGQGSNESIYVNVLKESAKPLLSLPRSLNQFLTDGARERAWKERYYQRKLFHQFYLFYGLISFIGLMISIGIATYGFVMDLEMLLSIGLGLSGVSFLSLFVISIRHFRNIYLITNNRRNNGE